MCDSTRDIETVLRKRVIPAGGSRYGLVIGIEKYRDTRLNLRCAAADARAIYELMVDPACGMFPTGNVHLLLDEEATREGVWRALAGLRRSVGENDTVWIYYAGHAAPEESDVYWVPHDADVDDLFATGLANDGIQSALGGIRAKQLLVMLDCCHAAAVSAQKNASRAVLKSNEIFVQFEGKGRITLASSDGAQKSVELSDVGHGAFTYFLEKGLRGDADKNGDGVVLAEELWEYLRDKVTSASQSAGNQQTPVWIGQMTHGLALSLNSAASVRKSQIASAVEALVGLGDENLTTEEARFCLDLLQRGPRDRNEETISAELNHLLDGNARVSTFKLAVQSGLSIRTPIHKLLKCPSCRTRLRIGSRAAGRQLPCPRCNSLLEIDPQGTALSLTLDSNSVKASENDLSTPMSSKEVPDLSLTDHLPSDSAGRSGLRHHKAESWESDGSVLDLPPISNVEELRRAICAACCANDDCSGKVNVTAARELFSNLQVESYRHVIESSHPSYLKFLLIALRKISAQIRNPPCAQLEALYRITFESRPPLETASDATMLQNAIGSACCEQINCGGKVDVKDLREVFRGLDVDALRQALESSKPDALYRLLLALRRLANVVRNPECRELAELYRVVFESRPPLEAAIDANELLGAIGFSCGEYSDCSGKVDVTAAREVFRSLDAETLRPILESSDADAMYRLLAALRRLLKVVRNPDCRELEELYRVAIECSHPLEAADERNVSTTLRQRGDSTAAKARTITSLCCQCNERLKIPVNKLGTPFTCPKCKRPFVVEAYDLDAIPDDLRVGQPPPIAKLNENEQMLAAVRPDLSRIDNVVATTIIIGPIPGALWYFDLKWFAIPFLAYLGLFYLSIFTSHFLTRLVVTNRRLLYECAGQSREILFTDIEGLNVTSLKRYRAYTRGTLTLQLNEKGSTATKKLRVQYIRHVDVIEKIIRKHLGNEPSI